ncbi:MAG: DDE-type integrase/transposase/recombinase [bacterium]|nr:DDE-type integrase/transposase/recombinase [bacterium]
MSAQASPETNRSYGVKLVCRVWDFPRSTYYAQAPRNASEQTKPKRRGPKPKISDEALLKAIRRDLDRSPFTGEGHRKVHARLRVLDGIRASRKRVLRVMRENSLLSPSRSRKGEDRLHDGRIVTDEPNVMWGTDGAKVLTLDDGWVWVFSAVEHWNAECVGWHVCKRGTRFNALEAVRMGVQAVFGSVDADSARGLALRMDHGSQYTSDHFRKQIRCWGISASWAFVEEPQTNGVAERFNRTLKEQAINGRIFRNVEEVRMAVKSFIELYNKEWMIEKNSFLSPSQARAEREMARAA